MPQVGCARLLAVCRRMRLDDALLPAMILQGKGVLESHLPEMPPNVHTVHHANECFDWGTFGWVRAMHLPGVSLSLLMLVRCRNSWLAGACPGQGFMPSVLSKLAQAIERRIADTSRYKHIIFLNSSVRGPFLPAYWPVRCWGLLSAAAAAGCW